MRIALVLDRFEPTIGGLERFAADLAGWLVARGLEVHVVAQTIGRECARGIVPHAVGPERSRRRRAARLDARAHAVGADLVHDLGSGRRSDLLQPLFGSRLADRRRTLRSLSLPRRLLRRFGPRSRLADRERRLVQDRQLVATRRIVACSRMVRDDLVALHGVDSERITVVPNGVDLARFDPAILADARRGTRERLGLGDAVAFLLVAQNWRLKGLSPAIRALARIPGGVLVVVGRGDPEPFLREAAALGVAGRCRFVGEVADPRPYYAAADVGLHPTFYDPCSLTVIEACASALPVVTTRWDGAHELLVPGREGFVVEDSEDADALAAAMARMLDRDTRHEMGARARRLAEANGLDRGFEAILGLYAGLVDEGSASAPGAPATAETRGRPPRWILR